MKKKQQPRDENEKKNIYCIKIFKIKKNKKEKTKKLLKFVCTK
jgi:hypothetical protein